MPQMIAVGRRSLQVPVVLTLLSILIVVVRLFSFNEPPEWDIGTYLVIGHELNEGKQLYLDIWDSKPPAIFVSFALAEEITGYGQGQIYFLSVVAAIVTLLGIYRAASIETTRAGLWAATLFACVCFEPTCGANLPNTEAFINAALAWAIALLLRMRGGDLQLRSGISIGLLFAVATMYKQVAVAPAMCLMIAHVIRPPEGTSLRRALVQAGLMACASIAAWAAVFGYFAATGRARLFYETVFVYPRFYSSAAPFHPLDLFRVANWKLRLVAPLALAAILAVLPSQSPRRRRSNLIIIAAMIGTYFAIIWPRHFWDHYFQLWFAILAILGGWGISRLTSQRAVRPWLGRVLGAVVALALIGPQVSWFKLDGERWAQRKYEPSLFMRARTDAKEISQLLLPNENCYAWTDEAWIYYMLNRRAPAAGLWKHHTLEGPLADWLSRRTVEQLASNPPEIFVDWENLPSPEDHPIMQFLRAHYRELSDGKPRWPFKLYILRRSALEARLRN